MKKNFYQLLEIPMQADKSTIRSAYLQLAKRYHPDMLNSATKEGKEASEQFKRITTAYETLFNDQKRRSYDMTEFNMITREYPATKPVYNNGEQRVYRRTSNSSEEAYSEPSGVSESFVLHERKMRRRAKLFRSSMIFLVAGYLVYSLIVQKIFVGKYRLLKEKATEGNKEIDAVD